MRFEGLPSSVCGCIGLNYETAPARRQPCAPVSPHSFARTASATRRVVFLPQRSQVGCSLYCLLHRPSWHLLAAATASLPVSASPRTFPANHPNFSPLGPCAFLESVRVHDPVAPSLTTQRSPHLRRSCAARHASAATKWRVSGDIIARLACHVIREQHPKHPGI